MWPRNLGRRTHLGAGLPANDDHFGALRVKLFDDGKAKALVATRYEHTFSLEVAPIVDGVDVEEPCIVLSVCCRKASDLVSLGVAGTRIDLRRRKGTCLHRN